MDLLDGVPYGGDTLYVRDDVWHSGLGTFVVVVCSPKAPRMQVLNVFGGVATPTIGAVKQRLY